MSIRKFVPLLYFQVLCIFSDKSKKQKLYIRQVKYVIVLILVAEQVSWTQKKETRSNYFAG